MNPNNQGQGGDLPRVPVANGTPATLAHHTTDSTQQAAATVIRSKIDALYGDSPVAAPIETAPQPAGSFSSISQESLQQELGSDANPYHRTHTKTVEQQKSVDPKQWKEYHSAWQDYYQKYYAAYYAHQDTQKQARQQALQTELQKQQAATPQQAPIASTPNPEPSQDLSKNQAMQELRNKLRTNVQKRAEKVRKSRHFIPVVAALAVVLLFVFIQYNRVFIATVSAYVSPGAIDPQNIIIDNGSSAVVGEEPRLIIPKINVDVPVIYGIGADHNSQMAAMEKGIAHFSIPGASSRPGEKGNTVLSGHSSNDLFDPGDYKFIFAQLEKLVEGDTIYANYEGKRYTYVVTKTEVVKPTQVDKLIYPTDKPVLTLITCTPLGTSLNRLLVTAEQISPSPTEAAEAPKAETSTEESPMPGNSATLFERLFGRR